MEKQQQTPPVPACVAPRRRFVLRFLLVCAGLTLAGLLVAYVRYHYLQDGLAALLTVPWLFMFTVAPSGVLCIPARTSRGSFLQLLGLVVPLLLTTWACGMCWGQPDYDNRLGYVMGLGWISLLALQFVYLPVWLLHLLIGWVQRRMRR